MNQSIQSMTILCLQVEVAKILYLRHEVLRKGLPFESAKFTGDEDPETYHFAAFILALGPDPFCCVSYMKNSYQNEPAFQLRGMATKKALRGQKLGSRLITEAEALIQEQTGIKIFWCNARTEAIPFYEKQGWHCVSEVFEIPDAGPHRKMVKDYRKVLN